MPNYAWIWCFPYIFSQRKNEEECSPETNISNWQRKITSFFSIAVVIPLKNGFIKNKYNFPSVAFGLPLAETNLPLVFTRIVFRLQAWSRTSVFEMDHSGIVCVFVFVLFVAALDLVDFRVKSPFSSSVSVSLCGYLCVFFSRWVGAISQKGWNVILPSLIM